MYLLRVVGRRVSIFRVEYEGTFRSMFARSKFSEISKMLAMVELLMNTPRLSKDKRSMDLVKRGAACFVCVEGN